MRASRASNQTTVGMTDLNGTKEVSVIAELNVRARNQTIWLCTTTSAQRSRLVRGSREIHAEIVLRVDINVMKT